MKIPLVKNQAFNVPEGTYRSRVVSRHELKEKSTCKSAVKILFAPVALETKQEQPDPFRRFVGPMGSNSTINNSAR
jgi:hypothetical protein